MKQVIIAFTSIFLSSVCIAQNQKDLIQETASVSVGKLEDYNKHLQNSQQQLVFQENKGQVSDQNYHPRPDVLFSGQSNGMVFHLKNKGISYQLNRIDSYKEVKDERTGEMRSEIDQSTIYRIDINWLNTNSATRVKKEIVVQGFNNYYLEHCPNGALNVLSYENITYQNIYNGIDLKWYSKEGTLKYDYLVAAGADYQQIVFEIEGAESIVINEKGELEVKTPLGTIVEQAPYVIQEGKELKSQWVINNNRIHFNIENIDASKPFVIDPIVRQWGTFCGGADYDQIVMCAIDASDNPYVTGITLSTTSPNISTVGSHQTAFGGNYDAFLVKFNQDGVRQWGTYYGGSGEDVGEYCATDASGNVYVSGWAGPTAGSVISTSGSHQNTYGGGIADAFLVKFNSSGVRQWGTFYGGTGQEWGLGCALNSSGDIYMSGLTYSASNISTPGSHQATYGLAGDAFLVKFNSSGVRQWSTYYGGSAVAGQDMGNACAVDGAGNVYMTGSTQTPTGTVIATVGSHQTILAGGTSAYLVKFNSAGVRQWGTYYGGIGGSQYGHDCCVDASGNVYIAGYTDSPTGTSIATVGSHQSTLGGLNDAFLVKFNSAGIRQWGTYYGGADDDTGYSCAIDASDNVYLSGIAGSTIAETIATIGSYQSTHGGANDAFLVKFNSAGVRQWGTYYGGSSQDWGNACEIDGSGNIYLAGGSNSSIGSSIASPGSHQTVFAGGSYDGFLVKFIECTATMGTDAISSCNPITWIDGNTYSTSNSTATHTLSNAAGCDSIVTLNFTRLMPTSGTATISSCTPITWINGVTYSSSNNIVTHTLTNSAGCDSIVTLNFTRLMPTSGTSIISSCTPITWIDGNTYSSSNSVAIHTLTNAAGCDSIVTLNFTRLMSNTGIATVNACNTYTWINGITYTSSTSAPTFTLTNAAGCDSIVTLNLTINSVSNLSTTLTGATISANNSSASYQWLDCNNIFALISGQTSQTFTPSVNGSYAVQLTQNGCVDTSACVVVTSVGITENTNDVLIGLYPNPNNGQFIIELAENSLVEITDILGKQVFKSNLQKGANQLNLSHIESGVYFVTIITGEKQVSVKIVKK